MSHPEINVIVREFAALNVFVGGEVKSPMLVPITGKLTALQAIFQVGGFKDTAELKNVVVLRGQGTRRPLFMVLNLKENIGLSNSNQFEPGFIQHNKQDIFNLAFLQNKKNY